MTDDPLAREMLTGDPLEPGNLATERMLEEHAVPTGPPAARRRGLPDREAPAVGGDTEEGAREALVLARRIVEICADKKAADIVLLSVADLTSLADYFVICSGGSERQLNAIADGIDEELRSEGVRPIGREGAPSAHWVLLDYGAVIIHIFAPPEREFYQLEKLWSEAPVLVRVQ